MRYLSIILELDDLVADEYEAQLSSVDLDTVDGVRFPLGTMVALIISGREPDWEGINADGDVIFADVPGSEAPSGADADGG